MKILAAIAILVMAVGFWSIHHDRIVAERRAEIKAANTANFQAYRDCLTAAERDPDNQPATYKGKENHKAAIDTCYAVFELSQKDNNK